MFACDYVTTLSVWVYVQVDITRYRKVWTVGSRWHKAFVQDVRILEIDSHMLERVARVNKDLTDSVEFEGVRRLIYTSSLFNNGQIGKFFGLIL